MSIAPAATAAFDEARTPDGEPRPHYRSVLDALERADLAELTDAVTAMTRERDLHFGGGDEPFPLDPVPRLITADEWRTLEAGLAQRVRALDRFVADVYSTQAVVREGVVPARVIASAEHFEPRLLGSTDPERTWVGIAGLDVVRCADGTFQVLEDNLRTPSGIAYALAVREVVDDVVPAAAALDARALDVAVEMLRETLEAAVPDTAAGDPLTVLLTDGPTNSAWYEHRRLAELLGIPLLTPADLRVVDGRLHATLDGRDAMVDVVYRRTDEDRVIDERGAMTRVASLLLGPWQDGTLGLVNAFGTGVADDKLIHAYVEDMIRFYLGEEPLLKSVPTYSLGRPRILDRALERFDDLVIKPRAGSGGKGVVICCDVDEAAKARLTSLIVRQPMHWIVQERVALSQHPTIVEGQLAPRHVDLRPFVYKARDRVRVVPGGLTRCSFEAGGLVVNSSRNGGAKDTRVLR